MNLIIFKKNFNFILIVVCFLSGNNVSSTSLQNFFDQNGLARTPSPHKIIISLSPNHKDVRRDGYSNSGYSNLFKLSNTTPLPLTPLHLYNQRPLSDYYSVPLSQYNPALQEYNLDALSQYDQIPTEDYNQELLASDNMGLSQKYSLDPYGLYNTLLIQLFNQFLQAYKQSLLRYNQIPLRYFNQVPQDYNQIQEFIPQFPEQFSSEEKNERLNEITQRYLQPNVPLTHQRCLDQPPLEHIESHRRGSNLDRDFTKVPHVAPRRKNPKPSNQNQFGNSKVVKPLNDNSEDLLNQVLVDKALEEKAGRRGNYQNGKYGKHVVPTYPKQSRKYANPFKSTAIVVPGKENEIVNPDANDDTIATRSQNNSTNQPSTTWNQFYPNILSWLGRKRRDVSKKTFDHDHVNINKNNAGVDLLHSKRQKSYEDEKMSIARRALRSLLRL